MHATDHRRLFEYVRAIFECLGSDGEESKCVARHLVEANLRGHDSHGVARIPMYIEWVKTGTMRINQHATVLSRNGSWLTMDGNRGFGQVVGEEAVTAGVEESKKVGIFAVALKNAGHLGCIGDFALQAADEGCISIHFVKSPTLLTAPFGGTRRSLSSNPIAIGVPRPRGDHLILDMATSKVAEGKILIARNKNQRVSENTIFDGNGVPTTDPNDFYKDPKGAIVPFGGHKGHCLSIMCDILGGALVGGNCSSEKEFSASNGVSGIFSIYVDVKSVSAESVFSEEIMQLIEWVKSSPKENGVEEIFMPGEVEAKTKQYRLQHGIPLDETTKKDLIQAARSVGVEEQMCTL
ncbi:MAG: malate/lactate/ureidoglycolate dehydrogenase [bacterium]|nr:malate/lactate/ureidoglycolate dehydrogenase [bacterium]